MLAIVKIRPEPVYRRNAFEAGLRACGYQLANAGQPTGPRDFLIQWNRKPQDEAQARDWERRGGTVIVCENGYIGRDDQNRQLYAISAHAHNGAGWFPVGTEDRFGRLDIDLKPWRVTGDHFLICGQRGIGSQQMASPPEWHMRAVNRIKPRAGNRAIRVRMHPGNHAPAVPLEHDLAGAFACVIWSSASGVRALTLGIPVLFDAPRWICMESARPLGYANDPICDDGLRAKALHRMSHGQWTVDEIERGEPFARMLERIDEARPC